MDCEPAFGVTPAAPPASLSPSTSASHLVPERLRFDRAPLRIYWEITRACALACRHCRAEASPERHPDELSPEEGRTLLEQIAAFGRPLPHVILTGGDPLERPDLLDLIAGARSLGLGVSLSPSATPRLTTDVIRRLAAAGIAAASLSLDGSTAERHDTLRGVPGTFDRTLEAARIAVDERLPIQVNTLVSAETIDDLPRIYEVVAALGVARWSLFFLVSVGRGTALGAIDPERAEQVMGWLADLPVGPGRPVVTTTEAPTSGASCCCVERASYRRRRAPASGCATGTA
jgi:MoaA/NifB/PqqE/SkfB family radical SAM enzyme